MGQDIPPAPPEAEVIRLARKAAGMTAEAAAAASKAHDPAGKGVSATYWRDVERGRGGRRGQQVQTRASDRTLAAMARVVGVEPRQLTGAGREDAARVLDEMLRREVPPQDTRPAAVPAPPADDLAEVRVLLAGLDRAKITARPEFDRVMKMVREFPDGVTIPGVFLYGDPRYQRAWDDLAGKEYSPGRAYTPPRMALVIAVQQWRDEREAAKREGKRDGGMAAGLSRAP